MYCFYICTCTVLWKEFRGKEIEGNNIVSVFLFQSLDQRCYCTFPIVTTVRYLQVPVPCRNDIAWYCTITACVCDKSKTIVLLFYYTYIERVLIESVLSTLRVGCFVCFFFFFPTESNQKRNDKM